MQVYLQLEHNELMSAKMSHSMQLFVIAGAAIETEDSLKPSLTADGQTKVHLQSTVWKQPKDTKDWGDEYISKEQPERGKDVGQSRYSSADNIICEPSLAGKDRGAQSCTHTWHELLITFYRRRHIRQFSLVGRNASGSPVSTTPVFSTCWLVLSENTQTCSALKTLMPPSKTCQVQNNIMWVKNVLWETGSDSLA